MANKVTSLSLGKVSGTDRTVYAQFKCGLSHLDKFDLEWEYYTGQHQGSGHKWKWFSGSKVSAAPDSSGGGQYYYTWNAPQNAQWVRFWVKPVAEKRSVETSDGKTEQRAYWTGEWAGPVWYCLRDYPLTPELTLSIDSKGENATVKAADTGSDPNVEQRVFSFYCQLDGKDYHVTKNPHTTARSATVKHANLKAGKRYWYRAWVMVEKPSWLGIAGSWSYATEWKSVVTRAATPTALTAKAGAVTEGDNPTCSVKLSWSHSGICAGYTVEWSANKNAWSLNAEDEIETRETTSKSYTVTGLDPGHTYYFRVWARGITSMKDSDQQESQNWSHYNSNGIVACTVGTSPQAPTTYATDANVALGDSVLLRWEHNCADSCAQQAAQVALAVNYVKGSGDFITVTPSGNPTSMTFDTDGSVAEQMGGITDGDYVSWWAKTKAVTGTWSAWSGQRRFRIWQQPTLSLGLYQGEPPEGDEDEPVQGSAVDDGDNPLTSYPLWIELDAGASAQTCVSYAVQLTAAEGFWREGADGDEWVPEGETLWTGYLDGEDAGNSAHMVVTAADCDLSAGVAYLVTASAAMDSGMRPPEAQASFRTEFDLSAPVPTATIEVDEDALTAQVRPACYVWEDGEMTDDLREDVTLDVYRVNADGSATLVAEGLPNTGDAVAIDPHPTFGEARYRTVATDSTTGAVGSDEASEALDCSRVVVQWDEAWEAADGDPLPSVAYQGHRLDLPYNIAVSESTAPEVALREYEGREHPVSYYGTQRREEGSWSVDLLRGEDSAQLAEVRRLQAWRGDCYVREPSGLGYWANVQASTSASAKSGLVGVSLTVRRVEGGV